MKDSLKIICVVGARPNFMKIAPIIEAIENYNQTNAVTDKEKIHYILVHTGQHYDEKMSKLFFEDLKLPKPDLNLEVGSSSHAEQTAEIMKKFEPICIQEKPTYVLVVGDVNSTIACALVAVKLGIKVIHVEAGLRSYDRSMPEEINRILTDAISDILFITEESGAENLRKEGIVDGKIHFVGNVMIDSLLKHREKAAQSDIIPRLGLTQADNKQQRVDYCIITLHRPSNVDNKQTFQDILEALSIIGQRIPIIFPAHPRTVSRIKEFGFEKYFFWDRYNATEETPHADYKKPSGLLTLIAPLGYLDFLNLNAGASLVLTDSGGVQEETTILGVPCVTIRENTERPITVSCGTNILAGTKKENIIKAALEKLNSSYLADRQRIPPLWDGKAAERIVEKIVELNC